MGRPKRDMTPEGIERRKIAGQRIKAYRKEEKGLSREGFAGMLESNSSSVQRWENGETEIGSKALKRLEEESGIWRKYWTGETEIKKEVDYNRILFQRQTTEAIDRVRGRAYDEEADYYDELTKEHINRLTAFFEILGYRFMCNITEDPGEYYFGELLGHEPISPYELAPISSMRNKKGYSDLEMDNLISSIKKAASFLIEEGIAQSEHRGGTTHAKEE